MSNANGGVQASEQQSNQVNVVTRIYNIPLIHDAVERFTSLVQSYGLTAAIYSKTEQLACAVLNATKPVQERLPLAQLNGFCNGCLDAVEHRFPRAFHIHANELIASAKKPASEARDVFQQRLAGAQSSLRGIQDNLSGLVAKVPRNSEDAQKTVSTLLTEINKTKDGLLTTAKELPTSVRQTVDPMIQDLQAGFTHVTDELRRNDIPLQDRAANAAIYLKDSAGPALERIRSAVVTRNAQHDKTYAEAAVSQ